MISVYQTIGAGQNLQYDIPGAVRDSMVQTNSWNRSTKKDFDAIYLDLPTNLTVNIWNDSHVGTEDFVKYIFETEYLQENGEISDEIARQNIKEAFGRSFCRKKFMGKTYKDNMKKILSDAEYSSSMSIIREKSRELEKYHLLQLLINGLTAKKHPLLRFNNLTGHLYVFRPEWTHKSKENVIWSIPTIEVKVLEDCLIKLNVRTFTSTRLRSKITFTKKKFEEYPKYVLSTDNSMRRKTADDDAKAPDFILRQIDGRKSGVKFLNISSEADFEATKIGVLNEVAENFNARYSGMASIEFNTIAEYTTIDTTATAKENVKAVRAYLADKKIILIDCVKNEQSGMFCENIVSLINEKYNCNAKTGSRLSKNALNIRLIHNRTIMRTV